jgi:FkbM family methyltransferase
LSLGNAVARWWLQQHWVSLTLKKSAYRRLSRQGVNPDLPFVRDFFGLRYEGNLRNGIEFAIYYYGAFEKPLLFFLRDAALRLAENRGEPICFCDIGSNIGQHSLFMSQHVRQVHAFEPYAPVRDRLRHHINLNQLQNIVIHEVGLGDQDAELNFFAPTGSNQGIGSFVSSHTNQREPETRDIGKLRVVNGDNYFQQHQIADPILLKIDVEGFERAALKGLTRVLNQHRPLVVCEITYDGESSFKSLEDLQQAFPENYRFFRFDTRKPDGSTARRRGSRAKRSGHYRLVPLSQWRNSEQDDIVAVGEEFMAHLPMTNH